MTAAQSPFERMRADHRRVRNVTDELERAVGALRTQPGLAQRRLAKLFDVLEAQFSTHMAAEDEIVFPTLLEALPAAAHNLEPLRAEHEDLRSMVSRLQATLAARSSKARDEQLRVQVRDLADLLRIHMRKEEAVAFRLAEQLMSPGEDARLSARLGRTRTTAPGTRRSRKKGRVR
jgi:hemerythrin-like domain-containing protein